MKVSTQGLVAITRHEGIVPAPYLDPVNIWTFGIGHTAMSGDPDPATMPRGMPANVEEAIGVAIRLFQRHITKYERDVRRKVTIPLLPHEFDMLVSFHFNTGGILSSSGVPKLNAGDKEGAWRVFEQWNKGTVNGRKVVIEGLVSRRADEKRTFFTGEYPSGAIPIWEVNARNRYSRLYRSMSSNELIRLIQHERSMQTTPTTQPTQPRSNFISRLTAAIRGLK